MGVGGGGCQILFGQIIYFGMGSAGKFIFMWHGLGKIYFLVNMVNHSNLLTEWNVAADIWEIETIVHCSIKAIIRNSNVTESSSIRRNY